MKGDYCSHLIEYSETTFWRLRASKLEPHVKSQVCSSKSPSEKRITPTMCQPRFPVFNQPPFPSVACPPRLARRAHLAPRLLSGDDPQSKHPSAKVTWVRFWSPRFIVGCVCWFSTLLCEGFSRVLQFSPKTNIKPKTGMAPKVLKVRRGL